MSTYDPIALQAYTDLENAFSIAAKLWANPNLPTKPTAEAFQATVATAAIHIKDLRRSAPSVPAPSQAVQPRAAGPARTAPAPQAAVEVPACPNCGGPMWDNREGKTNPKSPDFKCKDKECKDGKGMTTALWLRDLKKPAHAQAAAIRDGLDSYAEMPAALQRAEEPPLPF